MRSADDFSANCTIAYTYDAVGNRQTQNDNGTATNYGYDIANRLTSVNGQAYTWDNNGNLLSDGARIFTYDQANRLKTVAQGANNYAFAYNGLGDRLSQTVGVTATRYALDPAAGLTQVLADGTDTYLYGAGRIAQYGTAMQYFGADALGSVRQMYNASGQVIANARYDPFGNVLSASGAATSAYGFAGEWMDATGLEYLRARYYAPTQGRFVTRDVWEGNYQKPLTQDRWIYASSNPVNFRDPSGYITEQEATTAEAIVKTSSRMACSSIGIGGLALSCKNSFLRYLPSRVIGTKDSGNLMS